MAAVTCSVGGVCAVLAAAAAVALKTAPIWVPLVAAAIPAAGAVGVALINKQPSGGSPSPLPTRPTPK